MYRINLLKFSHARFKYAALSVFLGLVMSIMGTTQAFGQSNITGVVTDASGDPMQGVTVVVKNTTTGAITDTKGSFSIKAKPTDVLILKFLGYEKQEIVVGNQTSFAINMAEDAEMIGDVVVIGYGTQKKSHLTGSISKIENKTLDQIPLSRVDDALAGQITGVNIQASNPAAGEAPTIKVRGQGSISFDAAPLIVVDGIAVGSDPDYLSSLDMNDVASIEVLKDAASSSIYGSRGANGIIMITTKAGVEGPTQFSYNSFVGVKSVQRRDILPNLTEWMSENANESSVAERREYIEKFGDGTDWQDVMFDGGIITNHSLSARGGTKNTKFNASINYLNDQGVLLTDNYEKLNFRLNFDTKVNDRVRFGVVLNPSTTEQRRFPIGVHDGLRQNPWAPIYVTEDNIQYVNRLRENGRWADVQIGDYAMERMFDDFDLQGDTSSLSGTDISSTSNQNAYAKVVERDYRKYETKIFSNAYVNINLTDHLFFKQSIGGDIRFKKNDYWTGVTASRNGASDSRSLLSETEQFHTISESTLNFSKEIKTNHEINAVGGFAYEGWKSHNTSIIGLGYTNDFIQTIPAANVGTGGANTSRTEEALVSFLSRVNYAYADKYLMSLSARWDGSSKFGPDNRYGFFPAASFGWNIAREDFMKGMPMFSDLKARVSYGISGSNSGIGRYDYIGLISPVGTALGGSTIGYNATNISNSALGWEKLQEVNLGLDFALFKGKIGGAIDLYNRTSSDLLLDLPVPSVTGFETALVNKGTVQNRGFELEVYANPLKSKNTKWRTALLLTHNQNELLDFAGASGLISIVDDKRPAEFIANEGAPIAQFYGFVASDEIAPGFLKNPFYPIGGQSQDIYVRDLNGDGVIDGDDRTVLGSPYPDFIYSWNNTVSFLGFDLTMMIQGTQGAQVRNISSQYIYNEFAGNMDYEDDPNEANFFPDADLVQQRIFTSDDIQDADYFSLRNVNLGYTFNSSAVGKMGLGGLRVYLGGQNLIYRMGKDYVGFNPEGMDQGTASPLTFGYQRGPAPIFRTVSLGVNVKF